MRECYNFKRADSSGSHMAFVLALCARETFIASEKIRWAGRLPSALPALLGGGGPLPHFACAGTFIASKKIRCAGRVFLLSWPLLSFCSLGPLVSFLSLATGGLFGWPLLPFLPRKDVGV